MSQDAPQDPISRKRVVYRVAGMDAVAPRRDVEYRRTDEGGLALDLYEPPDRKAGALSPAVVLVAGYPDAGFQKYLGCRFKEMGGTVSWAQLLAASGIVAIAYANREPVADLRALLAYVRENAASLGIDAARVGLMSTSGNSPLALAALMEGPRPRCAVFCYGYMLDLDGATTVAQMSRGYGFVNPCAGKSIANLPRDVPLFLVRAGKDETPGLNETFDRFVGKALDGDLPLTVVNLPGASHAFDLLQDEEPSRDAIRGILAFQQRYLRALDR